MAGSVASGPWGVDFEEHDLWPEPWEDALAESWHEPVAVGKKRKLCRPCIDHHLMRSRFSDLHAWLEMWRQMKPLEPVDRGMLELTPLLKTLGAGGCYGGLSVPSLLASEILAGRIHRTTDVYALPGKVIFVNAKYFWGASGIDEIGPAEMRSCIPRES